MSLTLDRSPRASFSDFIGLNYISGLHYQHLPCLFTECFGLVSYLNLRIGSRLSSWLREIDQPAGERYYLITGLTLHSCHGFMRSEPPCFTRIYDFGLILAVIAGLSNLFSVVEVL